MNTQQPFVSLVVPAYNESKRIADPLRKMSAYLVERPYPSEIVVVDDGSVDATFDVVCKTAASLAIPVHAMRYERNRGKGFALKVGFQAARGERVLFTDADLSTPIEEMDDLLERIESGADIAIGSRKIEGAFIKVHQPWYRERMGKVFTFIVRNLIADVTDVTCGFKAFRGDVGRNLFSRIRIHDWSFDAELLLIAKKLGYRLEEVPVEWEDREGTKVNLMRDTVNSLIGLLRIRVNALTGRYREPARVDLPLETWTSGSDAVGRIDASGTSRSMP